MRIKLWLQNPKRSWFEKENLDLCHMYVVYNKLSTFICLSNLKYLHCNDSMTCIMFVEFDEIHDNALWESMNALMATMTMIFNHFRVQSY